MSLIVQKYGGSSVSHPKNIKQIAKKIFEKKSEGNDLVVVISAMGSTTDELIALAQEVSLKPEPREMDMLLTCGERIAMSLLAMALKGIGCHAQSFTGSQAGILTDTTHGDARIIAVTPVRLSKALSDGAVVIIAGFQGVNRTIGEITTLGRGGSDITAVALAAELGANVCEIYTDVDGVFTADPKIITKAKKINRKLKKKCFLCISRHS